MDLQNKTILLLGAGLMARPALDVLDKAGADVIVACRDLNKSSKLCEGTLHARPISLDVTDPNALQVQMEHADLAISLVPYIYHVAVVKSAIKTKTNVITTSYISPGLQELEKEIEEAGITVLNECGLDPGIDHCYAIKTIQDVHRSGGKVRSFVSNCGGLPAPEASDNPLGLKFSWSPRGLLLASQNPARYIEDGRIKDISGGVELMDSAKPYFVYPAFSLVAYANRDSSNYPDRYQIPEAHAISRGTLRYPGCVEVFKALGMAGFLDAHTYSFLDPLQGPLTWNEVTSKVLGESSMAEKDLIANLENKISFKSEDERVHVIHALKWLGIFSPDPALLQHTPLDTICALLQQKLCYEPGERDMVLLQHKFEIEWADGTQETRTSTLLEYGDSNGYSAMAKLVGVTCAVGSLLILRGIICRPGLLAPLSEDITVPLMAELKNYDIECIEKVVV